MKLMNEGDMFEPKHIYFSYFNNKSMGSPLIRMYIFVVNFEYDYKQNTIIDIRTLRYIYLQYNIDSLLSFDSTTRDIEDSSLYHIQYDEIWRLTEDEGMDVLSEVI
jgi:hypothetical protein